MPPGPVSLPRERQGGWAQGARRGDCSEGIHGQRGPAGGGRGGSGAAPFLPPPPPPPRERTQWGHSSPFLGTKGPFRDLHGDKGGKGQGPTAAPGPCRPCPCPASAALQQQEEEEPLPLRLPLCLAFLSPDSRPASSSGLAFPARRSAPGGLPPSLPAAPAPRCMAALPLPAPQLRPGRAPPTPAAAARTRPRRPSARR
ncbi:splicing factor, proline- and glutamine-rich-like [Sceloporus undulatus]|uniref:splicing factor, proline- and glutamine-rich-like n=1 Tax=Sceloporus undulatus TaxID=8520 RepID=UPI001C4B78CC|nr:splicing factor, proline- and glutamine-rich-like [Sceloporus undulatus]